MPSTRADAIQIPKSLSTQPVVWLDPSEVGSIRPWGTTVSGAQRVGLIPDKSGSNNHFMGGNYLKIYDAPNDGITAQRSAQTGPPAYGQTSIVKTINGLCTLDFSADGYAALFCTRRPTNSSSGTMAYVARLQGTATFFHVLMGDIKTPPFTAHRVPTTSGLSLVDGAGSPTFRVNGVPLNMGVAAGAATAFTTAMAQGGASGINRVNEGSVVLVENIDFSSWSTDFWNMGGGWGGNYPLSTHLIGEFLIYPGALSYSDRATLENYLMTKWAVRKP